MKIANAHIESTLYKTEVSIRDHIIIVDEPTELGGGNLGAAPSELLAASLASCTVITLRMYLARKEWDVESIDAKVSLEKPTSTEDTKILMEVHVKGNLDEKQMKRVQQIATKCPVHKMLSQNIDITTEVKE